MEDIKNSPHYQNGYYWGEKLAWNITQSIYKTIPVAIQKKEELLSDFKTDLGWDDENEKVLDLKGFIQALKDHS
jgi:hypothetical protein